MFFCEFNSEKIDEKIDDSEKIDTILLNNVQIMWALFFVSNYNISYI